MDDWVALRDAVDPDAFGAKAATLGRLLAGGLPVPSGVVLAPGAGADARDLWAVVGPGPVAVRSSAVGEDGPAASHAGIFESVLDVDGPDALEDAIAVVRASALGERARAYVGAQELAMAVLVQRQVAAVAAGVAFTANPVTGSDDQVWIGAVRGLAVGLVDGTAIGDEWLVGSQPGTAPIPVRTAAGAIDADVAVAVADLARVVEVRQGVPQDVEWAWDGDELWLVQARPMTGLPR